MKKIIICICVFVTICCSCFTASCGKTSKKSDVFDENNIVLSFSAMSDIHQQKDKEANKNKLVKALKYSEKLNGKPLDLALFAGDLTEEAWRKTNNGEQTDYTTEYNADIDMLKSALSEGLDLQKTGVFYALGNHDVDARDMGEEVAAKMPELFYNQLGSDYFTIDCEDSLPKHGLRHALVNGYHFFSLVTDHYWTLAGFDKEKLTWLDEKLAAVTAENPEQFVFVTAHPPIYQTVMGSCTVGWSDSSLSTVLNKYPQVVYFSGHLHNVLQDEIQISQNGYFTSLDCGSVKYSVAMNNMNDNNVNFDNSVGSRNSDFSQGLLIQVDKNGNLRTLRCNYCTENVIKDAWEISYPKADGSHLTKYDNQLRQDNNTAPVFPENATIRVEQEGTDITLSWQAATDDDMVRFYTLSVFMGDSKIKTYYLATHTYLYDKVSDMPDTFTWTFSEEDIKGFCSNANVTYSGEYRFQVTASDVWYKKSLILQASYTVASEAP